MEVVKKEAKSTTKKTAGNTVKKDKPVKKETTAVKTNKEEVPTVVEENKKEYTAPTIEVKAEAETETNPIVETVVLETNSETEVIEDVSVDNGELSTTVSIDEVSIVIEDNMPVEVTVESEPESNEEKKNEDTQPKRNNSAFNHYWNGQSSGW